MSYFHPTTYGLTVVDAFRPVGLIVLIWKAISHLKGGENPQYVLWVILHTLLSPRRRCSCVLWVKWGENCFLGVFQTYSAQDRPEKDPSTGFIISYRQPYYTIV